LFLDFWLGKPV